MMTPAKAAFINSLEKNGRLEPAWLVEAAKDPTTPVHADFEWDIEKAAEKHWLEQARTLIKLVRFTVTTTTQTVLVPFYVNDPERHSRTSRYVCMSVARKSREMSLAIFEAELDRMTAAIKRAQPIAVALGVEAELDQWYAAVCRMRSTVGRRPPKPSGPSPRTRKKPGSGRSRVPSRRPRAA